MIRQPTSMSWTRRWLTSCASENRELHVVLGSVQAVDCWKKAAHGEQWQLSLQSALSLFAGAILKRSKTWSSDSW